MFKSSTDIVHFFYYAYEAMSYDCIALHTQNTGMPLEFYVAWMCGSVQMGYYWDQAAAAAHWDQAAAAAHWYQTPQPLG